MKGILLGFLLVAVCALIHGTGIILISEWLIKRQKTIEGHPSVRASSILVSSVFAIIILLHLAEITIWAATYYCLNLLNDFQTSLNFSSGSYTTNGTPGIQLPDAWKLFGQSESIAGMLLVGLSTAFLFLMIHRLFELRRSAHEARTPE